MKRTFAFLLIFLLSGFSAKRIAVMKDRAELARLGESAQAYWQALRWGDFSAASVFIEDPSERFEWLKESGQSTARQYRSAEIISVDAGPLIEEHPRGIQREGVVFVQASFFTLPNQVVETEMIKQTWYRSAGGWFVDLKVE